MKGVTVTEVNPPPHDEGTLTLELESKFSERPRLVGFHQEWMSGGDDEVTADVTCGAGLGHSFILLRVQDDESGKVMYAEADIGPMVQTWIKALVAKLREEE